MVAFKSLVEFSKSAKSKTSRLLFLSSRLLFQKAGGSLEETKPETIPGYSPIIFSHSPMDLIYWRMVHGRQVLLIFRIAYQSNLFCPVSLVRK